MNDIYKEIQALNQSKLPPKAKALYLAFIELANDESSCKAILDSLVYRSGTSESSVIRATKELEAAGFISVRRFAKSGPSTPPNIYTLLHRTVKSRQIDSTSAVKLTSKNNIKIEDSTTSIACHPDTRGRAPSVRDDRLKEYYKEQSILKKYQKFIDDETSLLAGYLIDLIGLENLDSRLQNKRGFYLQKHQYSPSLKKLLQKILFDLRSPSQSDEVEA